MKHSRTVLSLLFAFSCMSLFAQQGDRKKDEPQNDPVPADKIPAAPALSVDKALKSFKVAKGFSIEVVASDPMIHDPVALSFDGNGRLWVVEMRNYMPDIDGKGENKALGRISILTGMEKSTRTKSFSTNWSCPGPLPCTKTVSSTPTSNDFILWKTKMTKQVEKL